MDDFLKSISRTLHMTKSDIDLLIEVLEQLKIEFQIIRESRSIIVLLPRRLHFTEQGTYIPEDK